MFFQARLVEVGLVAARDIGDTGQLQGLGLTFGRCRCITCAGPTFFAVCRLNINEGFGWECPRRNFELKAYLACVGGDVLLEVGARGEPLHAMRADEGLLARVDPHVPDFVRDLKIIIY